MLKTKPKDEVKPEQTGKGVPSKLGGKDDDEASDDEQVFKQIAGEFSLVLSYDGEKVYKAKAENKFKVAKILTLGRKTFVCEETK